MGDMPYRGYFVGIAVYGWVRQPPTVSGSRYCQGGCHPLFLILFTQLSTTWGDRNCVKHFLLLAARRSILARYLRSPRGRAAPGPTACGLTGLARWGGGASRRSARRCQPVSLMAGRRAEVSRRGDAAIDQQAACDLVHRRRDLEAHITRSPQRHLTARRGS